MELSCWTWTTVEHEIDSCVVDKHFWSLPQNCQDICCCHLPLLYVFYRAPILLWKCFFMIPNLRDNVCKSNLDELAWKIDYIHFLWAARHSCTYGKTIVRSKCLIGSWGTFYSPEWRSKYLRKCFAWVKLVPDITIKVPTFFSVTFFFSNFIMVAIAIIGNWTLCPAIILVYLYTPQSYYIIVWVFEMGQWSERTPPTSVAWFRFRLGAIRGPSFSNLQIPI